MIGVDQHRSASQCVDEEMAGRGQALRVALSSADLYVLRRAVPRHREVYAPKTAIVQSQSDGADGFCGEVAEVQVGLAVRVSDTGVHGSAAEHVIEDMHRKYHPYALGTHEVN